MDETTLDTRNLEKLIKAFKGQIPYVKVGVLGDKDARKGSGSSNATIGAKHEFGEDGLPVRSFLRVPITEHLDEYLEESNAFTPDTLSKVVKDGSIYEWVKTVGLVAEKIVGDAFDSAGFGRWKPSNMKYKKVQKTLIETNQLRDSITSEVVE